jgi:hypothetical protein
MEKFKLTHKTPIEIDDSLSSIATGGSSVEILVNDYNDAIQTACNKTFPTQQDLRHHPTHRSVRWWTAELTVLRKRTNALRRLFQRTTNNEVLRNARKTRYLECRYKYAALIINNNSALTLVKAQNPEASPCT